VANRRTTARFDEDCPLYGLYPYAKQCIGGGAHERDVAMDKDGAWDKDDAWTRAVHGQELCGCTLNCTCIFTGVPLGRCATSESQYTQMRTKWGRFGRVGAGPGRSRMRARSVGEYAGGQIVSGRTTECGRDICTRCANPAERQRSGTPGRSRTDTGDPFRGPASSLGLRG
jgi:hypothetical protein